MLGIDIIEIERIKKVVDAPHGENFVKRVYTEGEIAYCRKVDKTYKYNSLAARFAAKEAVAKAMGTGIRSFNWCDIEIQNDDFGKPSVTLHNEALAKAIELNVKQVHVSLSHTHTLAFASCYLEYNK